jgi:hypothetical protein
MQERAQPQQLHGGRAVTGQLPESQQPGPGHAGRILTRIQALIAQPPRQHRVTVQGQVTAHRHRPRVDIGGSLCQRQRKIVQFPG